MKHLEMGVYQRIRQEKVDNNKHKTQRFSFLLKILQELLLPHQQNWIAHKSCIKIIILQDKRWIIQTISRPDSWELYKNIFVKYASYPPNQFLQSCLSWAAATTTRTAWRRTSPCSGRRCSTPRPRTVSCRSPGPRRQTPRTSPSPPRTSSADH